MWYILHFSYMEFINAGLESNKHEALDYLMHPVILCSGYFCHCGYILEV